MLTLHPELARHLEALITRARNDADAPLKLDCKIGQSRVLCDFQAINDLASTFHALSVVNDSLRSASQDRLQQIAENLAERINYLSEPLRLIESDSEAETHQIRSEKPANTAAGIDYFELLVNRRVITLTRFRQSAHQRRQAIPATITHEIFERLIDDIRAAFAER